MARNGSGTYSLPEAAFVYDTVISETAMNSNLSDIASALTASIAKDGQTNPTANLPMATYRHTGVGNASARTDYAAAGQVQDGSFIWCGTAGGTADAITLTPSPAITAYATGQEFRWKAGSSANTGAATVAISGLTTKALEINDSALAAGEHAANKYYRGIYDGTAFQIEKISAAVALTDPMTTRGDILHRNSSNATARLAVGSANTVLTSDGTDPSWGNVTGPMIAIGSDAQGDILYHNGTAYTRLGAGTSGQYLQTQGTGANPQWATVSAGFTLGTEQATTSGTAFNFGSIPSGTKMIIIQFVGVSLSGTDDILVRIGDSGGIETSGYVSTSALYESAPAVTMTSSTAGFVWVNDSGTRAYHGTMILTLEDAAGFTWSAGHNGASTSGGNATISGGGTKSLSAELTQLTITRSGTNTFDAGAVNIMYLG